MAIEKLRSADDSFRRQLEAAQNSHQKALQALHDDKQRELDEAKAQVKK